jgi:hypothetical protein
MVLQGALTQLLADDQMRTMRDDAIKALQEAPLKRLRGDHLGADTDERNARAAATRFNVRLGQAMKEAISHPKYGLNSVFKDARAYRESQRQAIPDRKEISGMSSSATNGSTESALDENGRISKTFMNRIKKNLGVGG